MTERPAQPSVPETKARLSTLWVFALFNYLYADILTLMDPAERETFATGQVGSMQLTPGLLLGAALLMETAIVMVLLSRLLPHRANRWANIGVGLLHTAAVALSLGVGGTVPATYYAFFAVVEIACTLYIVWYAWNWKPVVARAAAL